MKWLLFFLLMMRTAIDLCARRERDIHAVIVENTFTCIGDLADVYFPFLKCIKCIFRRNKWSNIENIRDLRIPILFVAGMFSFLELLSKRYFASFLLRPRKYPLRFKKLFIIFISVDIDAWNVFVPLSFSPLYCHYLSLDGIELAKRSMWWNNSHRMHG